MATERNNYELPNNDEFENLLMDNLKSIKPIEMKEKEIAGQKQLFPFWNVVEPQEVHYSPESYLNAKQKKERSMKGDNTLVDRIENVMGKMKNTTMIDMTDVVKAPKNEMCGTTSVKQVTEWDSTSEMQTDVTSNAVKPKEDNVGAVKVKPNDLDDTDTNKQVTDWNSTEGVKEVSHAVKAPEDNVGAVKPQETDMGSTSTDKQVTSWNSTEDASKTKKPKGKFDSPYGGIDFSKFM